MIDNPYRTPGRVTSSLSLQRDFDGKTFSTLVLCGLCLAIALISWMCVSTGVPAIYSPFPLLVILPVFFGLPLPLIVITASGIFGLSQIHHFIGNPRPKPNLVFAIVFVIVTALTPLWIFFGWSYSLGYHGPTYTVAVTIANLICAMTAWSTWLVTRTPGRYRMQVIFGFALFAWIFWFAFPYMGELP